MAMVPENNFKEGVQFGNAAFTIQGTVLDFRYPLCACESAVGSHARWLEASIRVC
jgi:hypothetical protein